MTPATSNCWSRWARSSKAIFKFINFFLKQKRYHRSTISPFGDWSIIHHRLSKLSIRLHKCARTRSVQTQHQLIWCSSINQHSWWCSMLFSVIWCALWARARDRAWHIAAINYDATPPKPPSMPTQHYGVRFIGSIMMATRAVLPAG